MHRKSDNGREQTSIMFVCSGNICRSPLAHAVFQELVDREEIGDRYRVESAGTSAYHVGDHADPRMRRTAKGHGTRIDHRARQFSERDFERYDLILVMDRYNYDSVRSLARNAEDLARVRMFREFDPVTDDGLEVPDPYYGGNDGFELVYEMVDRTSRNLLDMLETDGDPEAARAVGDRTGNG